MCVEMENFMKFLPRERFIDIIISMELSEKISYYVKTNSVCWNHADEMCLSRLKVLPFSWNWNAL